MKAKPEPSGWKLSVRVINEPDTSPHPQDSIGISNELWTLRMGTWIEGKDGVTLEGNDLEHTLGKGKYDRVYLYRRHRDVIEWWLLPENAREIVLDYDEAEVRQLSENEMDWHRGEGIFESDP